MPWTPPRDNCDGNDDSGDNDDGDEDEDEDEDDDEATEQGSLRWPGRQTHTQGTYCQTHCSNLGRCHNVVCFGTLWLEDFGNV